MIYRDNIDKLARRITDRIPAKVKKLSQTDPEYECLNEILNDEQNKWKESVKAAKEFNIPIVKINRERCAKSEKQKIENNFKKYLEIFINNYI